MNWIPRLMRGCRLARIFAVAAVAMTAAGVVVGCAAGEGARQVADEAAEPQRTAVNASSEARFVGGRQLHRRDGSVRNVSGFSVYGEIAGGSGGGGWRVDAADNLRQITATRTGSDFDVAVDPEGEWLCFASTRHDTLSSLYLRRAEGATITQLTGDAGNDVTPAFSPDGRHIAFASDRSGAWNIYIKPVEGGNATQITDNHAHELHPTFSPDGRELAFSALSSRSGHWEIVVVDLDNPSNRRFIGYGLFPSFSPDGSKIAFQRARQRDSRIFSIWTVDYVDGEGRRPTEIAAASNAAVITPSWSPDGDRLAFAVVVDPAQGPHDRPDEAALWVVDVNGTNRVRVTQDRYANLQPAWGPDGAIYFISNRAGNENIWSLRAADRMIAGGRDDEPQAAAVPTD